MDGEGRVKEGSKGRVKEEESRESFKEGREKKYRT